jgi:uncharacterized protein YndB with AHSA1/START domain
VNDIEVSIRIDARPETVFRYFVDPERMCTWMGVAAEVDPRPGGGYRVDVNGRDVAIGEYIEVVADERVVWTWGWDGNDGIPPGSSTVEVTLTPDGDATVVRLRHSGLPDDSAAKNHSQGWEHYAARLALAAAGRDPGPDVWLTPK